MKKIYLSKLASPALTEYLIAQGCQVVPVGPISTVEGAISTHADLLHCSLGPGRPVFHGREENLGPVYPADVIYNACATGRYFIHKLKVTDFALLSLAKSRGLTFIDVAQGYARCSCLPIDEEAIITSDDGIGKACARAGLAVLKVTASHVALPGYAYGFIGGAGGRVGNAILFHGCLDTHPDAPAIREFIRGRGLQCLDFYHQADMPLTDIGSIIEEVL